MSFILAVHSIIQSAAFIRFKNFLPFFHPPCLSETYMVPSLVKEASGLFTVRSTLYMQPTKADKDSEFYCTVEYSMPGNKIQTMNSDRIKINLNCKCVVGMVTSQKSFTSLLGACDLWTLLRYSFKPISKSILNQLQFLISFHQMQIFNSFSRRNSQLDKSQKMQKYPFPDLKSDEKSLTW